MYSRRHSTEATAGDRTRLRETERPFVSRWPMRALAAMSEADLVPARADRAAERRATCVVIQVGFDPTTPGA